MLVNKRDLKEKIMEKFDILEARIYTTFLESELDGISIEHDDNLTVAEIEKMVLNSLIKTNELYSNESEAVLHLLLDFKEQVNKKDYDSKAMTELLKEFYKDNFEGKEKIKSEENKERKAKKEIKIKLKDEKKQKIKKDKRKRKKSQATFDEIFNIATKKEISLDDIEDEIENEVIDSEESKINIDDIDDVKKENLEHLTEDDLFDDGSDDFD
jgi:hypothetical protein